jgi:hypothetical protein
MMYLSSQSLIRFGGLRKSKSNRDLGIETLRRESKILHISLQKPIRRKKTITYLDDNGVAITDSEAMIDHAVIFIKLYLEKSLENMSGWMRIFGRRVK